jgi:hypothetical protein
MQALLRGIQQEMHPEAHHALPWKASAIPHLRKSVYLNYKFWGFQTGASG